MLFTKPVIGLLVSGFVIAAIGGGMFPLFSYILRKKIDDQVPLTNNSESFNNWLKPPIPVYFQVYVFNYTNSKAIQKNGTNPAVTETGPYTYREHIEKVDVVLKNGTVSYREKKYYIFDKEKSVGPESNVVVTPNLPVLTVVNFVRYTNATIQALVNMLTFMDKPFKTLTVGDIIWGYKDPLIASLAKYIPKSMNVSLPKKFGIFYGKNGTDDGNYIIYSGTKNVNDLGNIESWNGVSSLPYWNSPYCNMINGSDGTLFSPFKTKDSNIYIFSTDICRSVHATFDKKLRVHDIPVYRYTPPADLFATGDVEPANKGFCTPNCLPSGLLNVSKCHQDAPIVLSQPHFYQADDAVIKNVTGIKPDPEKHSTQLDIEPTTGLGLHLAKRLQINLMIEAIPEITISQKVDKKPLPVLWIDENAKVDTDTAQKFQDEVGTPMKIMTGVKYGLLSLGIFLILLALLLLMRNAIVSETKRHGYEQI
ncbi:lysosome membrane protein 2 [Octopus bimaculoides]|uniref:Scavenger receptor class B member 1 n=1 Tax=Octopus bimaculoides TaxID=37653 RepID=A0A0L8GSK3_OCTBM|nr:lysosome membrane protein 2 [Octopus bimaculoides]|eukprot:XP_014778407.1 PREDICTED: lysosome membrane protein 2-like isoform X1 [Octopus bimaculoides]